MLYPKGLSAQVNTEVTALPSRMIFLNIILFWKIFFLLSDGYGAVSSNYPGKMQPEWENICWGLLLENVLEFK